MEISTILYVSLLLHFIGDYVLQNDWMAQNKTKSAIAAAVHAVVYSSTFLLILGFETWLIVLITHYLIDRYSIASYWVNSPFYANGKAKQPFVSFWITVIVDNTMHILINSAAVFLEHGRQ